MLFASDNAFTHLPESIGQCPQLQIVGLKANRIEQVSAAALPPRLRWLILTDNRIESLPDELGCRPDLQKLMLAGNRLRTLPATLAQCHKLELIRIAANRLTELPDWLLSLPALAWLAFADNPLCAERPSAPIREIPRNISVFINARAKVRRGSFNKRSGTTPALSAWQRSSCTRARSPAMARRSMKWRPALPQAATHN